MEQTTHRESVYQQQEEQLIASEATVQDFVQWQKAAEYQLLRHLEEPGDDNETKKLVDLMKWEFEHIAASCIARTTKSETTNEGFRCETFILRQSQDLNRSGETFRLTFNDNRLFAAECVLHPLNKNGRNTRVYVRNDTVLYEEQKYRYLGDDNYMLYWESVKDYEAHAIHERFSVTVTDALIARMQRTKEENLQSDEHARTLMYKLAAAGLARL